MGGGGDDIAVWEGARVEPGGDEAGDVGDVGHEVSAHLTCNLAEGREVDGAGVRTRAAHDELGLVGKCELPHGIHVEVAIVAELVVDRVVQLTGAVHGRAVGEVAAMGEVEAEEGVAGFEQCEEDRAVGLGARVRLDVYAERAAFDGEELAGTLAGDVLGNVDELAAPVVAPTGQAFGVLVGERTAHRFENSQRRVVLRCDELEVGALTGDFGDHGGVDFGIGSKQRWEHEPLHARIRSRRLGRLGRRIG